MILPHTNDSFEPAATLLIDQLATLRVMSDKLRSQIVELLRAAPRTVKQLAEILDLAPRKLYYHINMLEQHGLIRVVSTRITSGIVEKTYRATAYLFLFEQTTVASTDKNGAALNPTVTFMFQSTQQQLEQSVESGLVKDAPDAPMLQQLFIAWNLRRLTPDQAEAFYARLEALMDEFNVRNDDAQAYRLFVTLFPVDSNAKFLGEER